MSPLEAIPEINTGEVAHDWMHSLRLSLRGICTMTSH